MAAAFVSNTGGINLDSSVTTLTVPAVIASGYNVVHVAIRSKIATVMSVTDDAATPNTYTKRCSVFANTERDYTVDEYDIPPKGSIFFNSVEAETWTATVSNACKNVIVTLTTGAKFAVQVNNYTSGTGISTTTPTSAAIVSSSAPSISLTPAASTSIVSVNFASATLLNQAAGLGTLRGSTAAATTEQGVACTTVDRTGVTPIVVSLAPTNTEVISGDNLLNGNINATQITVAVPATYAVTAVEIKA
jgi:hypothetical protein